MIVPLLAGLAKRGLFKWITESGVGQSLIAKYTGNQLTGAEREANQFTAEQAELSRQFQEDMYTKYQSPAAMMRQYADAGLNPALMYGGAGSPSQSFSSPAGSSVSPASGFNLLDSIVSLMRAKAEISNIKADTEGKRIDNQWKDWLNQASLGEKNANIALLKQEVVNKSADFNRIVSETAKNLEESKLISEHITSEELKQGIYALDLALKRTQKDIMDYQLLREEWIAEYRYLYGSEPGSSISSSMWTILATAIGRATGELTSFSN